MDLFDTLSETERIVLQFIIIRWRDDAAKGKIWTSLWPANAETYFQAISVPQVPTPPVAPSSEVVSVSVSPKPADKPLSPPVDCDDDPADETIREDCSPLELSKAGCRDAIILMFRQEQRRMSAGAAQLWLEDHGKTYSLNTVTKYLSELRTDGQLDNDNDSHGRGYGLAEWSEGED